MGTLGTIKDPDESYYDYHHWIECDECGGEGRLEDECECEAIVDICFCETPTPRRCWKCKGAGGWDEQDT